MSRTQLALTPIYLLALAWSGCASEAYADPSSAALRGSAGAPSTVDLDDDADEDVDEADDLDDHLDEDLDDDVDEDTDEATEESADRDDDNVAFDALPAAVQPSVKSVVGTGTITDIDRDEERSGVVYEVDYTRDGARYELDVAEDGTVLRNKLD